MASPPKGIDWFQGSVKEAFRTAKSSRRPLFLYWGAQWCPPCNKMKKTVFSKPPFKEKIKGFVSVYFDGDQDRAQIWGEKLKAKGYPTMMIYNADGNEIMRLPIDVSMERYVELLDAALQSNAKTIAQIVKSVEESSAPSIIPRRDWSMLAGHAWFQDELLGLGASEKVGMLKRLYQKVPKTYKEERYRFFILYLSGTKEDSGKLGKYASFLEELLGDGAFIDKNFTDVILKLPVVVRKVYSGKSAGERERAEGRLLTLAAGKAKTPEEKLLGLYPAVVFNKGKLPASLEGKLVKAVEEVDRSVRDKEGRQNIMSTAVSLLRGAGLLEKAKYYAAGEIKKSASPWYFMEVLGGIEQKMGNTKASLEWSLKAWNSSQGPNTRFAQGSKHLMRMMSLGPEDRKSIGTIFAKVLKEIVGREDAFSGRNRDVFERLGKAVAKWDDKQGRRELWEIVKKSCEKSCQEKMRGWGFAS